jgi:hypothetical protein
MTPFVTQVQVWFNSEGASPSEVIEKLTELGFTPVRGAYDFIYEHDSEEIGEDDISTAILDIANAIHAALSGFKVFYTLDTHEGGDYIPLEDIDAELEATRKELQEIEDE